MYKLMPLVYSFFLSTICLCQEDAATMSMRLDSFLNEEILNYSEIKNQLSVSVKNIEIDKTLLLSDSVQVIQFKFGITGYKVRIVFCLRENNIFPLSFGRSDYLVYFKKGYRTLTHLYSSNPIMIKQEAKIADALLPECYKTYTCQNDSSLLSDRRTFFQSVTTNERESIENSKDGVLGVNTIFPANRIKFYTRKGKFFLSNLSMRKNRRKELIKYEYPKIDVIPITIIKKH